MKLVVGLGNPGKKYEKTRHNIGFRVISAIEKSDWCKNQSSKFDKKFNAEITECEIDNEKYILAKPQTFMNNSGEAVSKIVNFYKIKPEDIIIASDDIDLELGKCRSRLGGSSGGHNGLESIIDQLGTDKFWRARFGVKKSADDKKQEARDFVLGKLTKKEEEIIDELIEKAINEKLEEKTITVNR